MFKELKIEIINDTVTCKQISILWFVVTKKCLFPILFNVAIHLLGYHGYYKYWDTIAYNDNHPQISQVVFWLGRQTV